MNQYYSIQGGRRLEGTVTISGAKNAAVAIIPAAILAGECCILENLPAIQDVQTLKHILSRMGAQVDFTRGDCMRVDPTHINTVDATFPEISAMRASYYLLGAMLGAYGEVELALPGGCVIGPRPIDQHIKGFEAMCADVELSGGYVIAKAPADGLKGARISLDVVSVGATMNIMIGAVLANGTTYIENAAKEPHIVDLANFLNAMGANIYGAGTDVIRIKGVKSLHGGTYSIIPDQIEAGTYMAAAAAVGGDVLIQNVIPKHLESITAKLKEMGARVTEYEDAICVIRTGKLRRANVNTLPYPGFPTDMQSQVAVCMALARGTSIINEGIYDTRFRYCAELNRMGAKIKVGSKLAIIDGVEQLHGCAVKACDLRAGAAMVIAGLAADGTTTVEDVHFIERGYECMIEKLRGLGADITRIETPDPVNVRSVG